MTNWLKMTASDLGRGIGSGGIDPVELCDCYLEAIVAHPLRDRIYARITPERAMSEAEAARARAKAGLRLSPLDGVPISWKDLFDTAGIATEAGSALLKDRVPAHDARVLRNATHAGLVCLGKTHMSELAFSGLGYNPVTETSPCVNDLDAVAGGSSSGAATSVAFDLAAAGIGSDTGGSVRLPAAWNDLVGLKTTAGLLSLDGVVKLIESFDTVGPLTRSVEDAAALMALMLPGAMPDLRDADLSGRRFAVLNTIAMSDLETAPAAAFEQSLERLSRAGAQIDSIEFPELAVAMDLSGPLYTAEAYGEWGEMIEANPGVLFAGILDRFEAGAKVPASAFYRGWQRLRAIRSAYAAATDGFDAVLLPSVPILPPKIDRLASDHDYFTSINLTSLRNTRIGNLLGLCALTLPTGTPSCGVMMMAKPNSEAALLRLGAAAEKALA